MASAPPHQPVRADGIEARQRLLAAGLKLFAEHGFGRTSVRALAQAARVNIGAVGYYFGDKEGLYRALFSEPPIGDPHRSLAFADPSLPVPDAMRRFYAEFLAPLKLGGDQVRQVMKLHFREMAEPTGAWQCALDGDIRPQHDALVALLVRALGLRRADTDVERLAVAIAGLAVHVFAFHDGVRSLSPQLLATPKAIDSTAARLAGYAVSMIDGERARRAAARRETAR